MEQINKNKTNYPNRYYENKTFARILKSVNFDPVIVIKKE